MKGKSPETTPPQKRSRTSFLARSPWFPGMMPADVSPSPDVPAFLPLKISKKFCPPGHPLPVAPCPQLSCVVAAFPIGSYCSIKSWQASSSASFFPASLGQSGAFLESRGGWMQAWEVRARPSCLQEPSQGRAPLQASQGWMELGGGLEEEELTLHSGHGETRLKRDPLSTLCSHRRQPWLQRTRGQPSCSQAFSGPSPVKLGLSAAPLLQGGAPHSCKKGGGEREGLTAAARVVFLHRSKSSWQPDSHLPAATSFRPTESLKAGPANQAGPPEGRKRFALLLRRRPMGSCHGNQSEPGAQLRWQKAMELNALPLTPCPAPPVTQRAAPLRRLSGLHPRRGPACKQPGARL